MPQQISQDDILVIQNIDIDCDDVTEEIETKFLAKTNPETGQVIRQRVEEVVSWAHKDFFQVKKGGYPYRIAPGETRRYPRYIGEHYANHLIDHMLMKKEKETNQKNLVRNPAERKALLDKIIIDTEYLHREDEISEDQKTFEKVKELNKEPGERSIDLGQVPDKVTRALPSATPVKAGNKPAPVKNTGDVAKTSVWDKDKPKPTKKELLAQCEELDIETTGKETVDELIDKVKKF